MEHEPARVVLAPVEEGLAVVVLPVPRASCRPSKPRLHRRSRWSPQRVPRGPTRRREADNVARAGISRPTSNQLSSPSSNWRGRS
eukprot:6110929-Heterocapsa_arctica.AAC.1